MRHQRRKVSATGSVCEERGALRTQREEATRTPHTTKALRVEATRAAARALRADMRPRRAEAPRAARRTTTITRTEATR